MAHSHTPYKNLPEKSNQFLPVFLQINELLPPPPSGQIRFNSRLYLFSQHRELEDDQWPKHITHAHLDSPSIDYCAEVCYMQ